MKLVKSLTYEWFAGCFIAKLETMAGGSSLFMESVVNHRDKGCPSTAAQEKVMNEVAECLKS